MATDSALIEHTAADLQTSYQSEIEQTATEINAAVTDLKTGVVAAGVNLNGADSSITLHADTTTVETSSGTAVAVFGTDTTTKQPYLQTSLIKAQEIVTKSAVADVIDAQAIVTEGLTAQTIDAGDATLQNLTVEGYLRSATVAQVYAADNPYFVGDEELYNGALNIVFENSGETSATGGSVSQQVYLPPDYDFIGSHVMLFADNTINNTGATKSLTSSYIDYLLIRAGRSYMKHAYMCGAGTSASPYYVPAMNCATDGLATMYQTILQGASYFGRWAVTNNDVYYNPNMIKLGAGYIELVGIPSFSSNVPLFPYTVSVYKNSGEAASNSHLIKSDDNGNISVAAEYDPLHAKFLALYKAGGESTLPTGVHAKTAYVQYVPSGMTSALTAQMTVFTVPLCRWYPVNVSVGSYTGTSYVSAKAESLTESGETNPNEET